MKIKTLLSVALVGAVLFVACKKSEDDSATPTPAKDVTPPVITVNGSNPISVTQNASYTDASATAMDAVDGACTVTSNVSGTNPKMNTQGTYTVTYSATDKSGNVGHATRKIMVVSASSDVTPPVITLNGITPMTVSKGVAYSDAGASAYDVGDGLNTGVTHNVTGTNPNVNVLGTYTITYTSKDSKNNTATANRIVIVANSLATDYIWTNGANGYMAVDSDAVTHVKSTFAGCKITAGSGIYDIKIGCFDGTFTSLTATVSGSSITLSPASQTISSSTFTGSGTPNGTLNGAKNIITLNLNNSSDGHKHIYTLTKQ